MKWYWKTAIALGFVGVVAMGAAAFGQSGPSSPAPAASSSAQAQANPRLGFGRIVHADATLNTRKGLAQAKIDGGTVTSVDADTLTLTIKRADGQSVSFTATDATRVRKDREKATFGDIKVGDFVQVIQIDRGDGFVVALIRDRSAAAGADAQTSAGAL
jgi:hypothetical protein